MAEPPPSDTVRVKVTRDLGLRDVVVLGLTTMVGAGVFVLSGTIARVAGVAAVLGIGMAAFVVLLNSLAYAELAGARPDAAGGGYGWVRGTLPAPTGFVSGWLSWAGHLTAAALSAAGIGLLADYLLDAVLSDPGFPIVVPLGGGTYNVTEKLIAVVVYLAFVGAGARRFSPPSRRISWVGIVKLSLIVAFVAVAGISLVTVPDLTTKFGAPLLPGPVPGVTLAAGMFFVAFQGFETIAQISDRVKSPHRTVPAGIFVALGTSVALYLAFYLVILGNVPTDAARCTLSAPTAWDCLARGPRLLPEPELGSLFAASAVPIPFGGAVLLFVVGAVVAMATALPSNLASATRIAFTMARDGNLPGRLGDVREATRTPRNAQLAGGLLGLLFLLPLSIEGLAATAGILFLLLYTLVNFALIAERRRHPAAARGFRVLLVPIVPVLTAAVNLALAVDLFRFPRLGNETAAPGEVAWYLVGLWLSVGLIMNYFLGGRESVTHVSGRPRVELLDVLSAGEDRFDPARYRVFLPLREFDDAPLVEFGAVVAKERNGELSLLNVVEIPGNLPPKAIKFRYVDDRIRGLQKLARIGERMGVDTRAVVKIGNRVYEIILDTLKEEDVNLLVMGWRGERAEGDRRILGSNIDYLIENAPCDVAVFKTRGLKDPISKIVVLSSPLWSVRGVDELALILAKHYHAALTVASIVEDPAAAESIKADTRGLLEKALALGLDIEQKVVYSKSFESTALRESAGADLLLLRASPPGGLRKYSLGPVEDRIAKLAQVPVVIFRKGAM